MSAENKFHIFVDPSSKQPLILQDGQLVNLSGRAYGLKDGIPDLIYPIDLNAHDLKAKQFYEGRAAQYEDTIHLTFYTFDEDELIVRSSFIDKLCLRENDKVLEIACGTGRDSVLIAERLKENGELHMQDLSMDMISVCAKKMANASLKTSFCLSNAAYLPYPDKYFDATYSFGAMGEFSDKRQVLKEMVRVTKTGGKIVFGDESIPVWHRNTEFYKILKTTNYMYEELVPFEAMPVEARNVSVKWVIGGTFYLVDFEVGEGEPTARVDYDIPGIRGGSYRTRYEGQLEGVKPETKRLAWEYVKKNNLNMHQWLDGLVNKAVNNSSNGISSD